MVVAGGETAGPWKSRDRRERGTLETVDRLLRSVDSDDASTRRAAPFCVKHERSRL